MGKKRSAAKKVEPAKQKTLFALKGNEEYGEWMSELALFVGLPLTNTVDQALKAFAELKGFNKPIPKRQIR